MDDVGNCDSGNLCGGILLILSSLISAKKVTHYIDVIDAAGLKDHSSLIEKIEAFFENEISLAEENVRNSFKVCFTLVLEVAVS